MVVLALRTLSKTRQKLRSNTEANTEAMPPTLPEKAGTVACSEGLERLFEVGRAR